MCIWKVEIVIRGEGSLCGVNIFYRVDWVRGFNFGRGNDKKEWGLGGGIVDNIGD